MTKIEITEEMVDLAHAGANRLTFGEGEVSRTRIRNSLSAALDAVNYKCEHDFQPFVMMSEAISCKPGLGPAHVMLCRKCYAWRPLHSIPQVDRRISPANPPKTCLQYGPVEMPDGSFRHKRRADVAAFFELEHRRKDDPK